MSAGFHDVRLPDKFSRGSTGGLGFSTEVVTTEGGAEQRNVNWDQDRGRFDISHLVKTPEDFEEIRSFFAARMGRAYGFRFKWWADYHVSRSFIAVGDGATTQFQLARTYANRIRGTARGGGASSITLAAAQPEWPDHGLDDTYNTRTIRVTAGTGAGQVRVIADYVGASKLASVAPAWEQAPDATSEYAIELFTYRKDVFKPVEGTVTVYVNGTAVSASVDNKTGLVTVSPAPATEAVITADFEFDLPVRFDVDLQAEEFRSIRARSWRGIRLIETRDI